MGRRLLLAALCASALTGTLAGEPSGYINRQLPMVRMAALLRLVETIPLPTEGYMDHLACDLRRQHLFISGENNNEMVTVDLAAGRVVHVTPLAGHPRKPAYDATLDRLWVDLGNNTVVALSGASLEPVTTIELTGGLDAQDHDPDNAAYDPVHGRYYVAVRNRTPHRHAGSIEIVDTRARRLIGHIPLQVDEPAALALDQQSGRLYIGVGDALNGHTVVKVLDTAHLAVISEWSLAAAPPPHAAAIDTVHKRLFLASRLDGTHTAEPGRLAVLNAETGSLVQVLDAPGGGDELFYDEASARVYFSGSTGSVAVYHEDDADHFRSLGEVPTGALAKSGLWVPELRRYYSAVPGHLVQVLPVRQYGAGDWVTEQAHLMVYDQAP